MHHRDVYEYPVQELHAHAKAPHRTLSVGGVEAGRSSHSHQSILTLMVDNSVYTDNCCEAEWESHVIVTKKCQMTKELTGSIAPGCVSGVASFCHAIG